MLVVIRADGTALSGVGHVMRCLALAEEFAAHGDRIHWIGDLTSQPWLADKALKVVGSLTEPAGSEYQQANQVIGFDPDLTIVDSYNLRETFCSQVRNYRNVLVVVVDPASRLAPADLYVAPGVGLISQELCGDTPMLQGPSYVLIRQELQRLKERMEHVGQQTGAVEGSRRVAVVLGGTDVAGIAPSIVTALESLDTPLEIDAVPRPTRAFIDDNPLSAGATTSVTWWNAGADIYPRISGADLVISAAGVSSWEFLYLGLPLALVEVADNQAANYQWMTSKGYASGIGRRLDLKNPERLRHALRDFIDSNLDSMRSRGPIIDGFGARRVVNAARQLVRARNLRL